MAPKVHQKRGPGRKGSKKGKESQQHELDQTVLVTSVQRVKTLPTIP